MCLSEAIDSWELPAGGDLLDRVERMVEAALFAGHFDVSFTRIVSGLQYHLGGSQDTAELADICRLTANDRVLDVCCFIGGPAIQLVRDYQGRVSGVDLDSRMVRAASRIADACQFGDLTEFVAGDAAHLPWRDRTFDVVWTQCSLFHRNEWIAEFDRVLRPGGRLAMTFQTKGSSDEQTPFSRWALDDLREIIEELG